MTRVVIAGGGVAGAAAACLLAAAGVKVRLFERQAVAMDKICGEFLSHEALYYLRRLGLDVAALGGQDIARLRLVRSTAMAESALPFRGAGLSRRVLDEALLARAAALGAQVVRGQALRPDDAAAWQRAGATVFLATGKHELRGFGREIREAPEDLVGLKTYFAVDPVQHAALAGHVELILFAGGYAGLQRVEGGRANLCLLIRRARWQAAGGTWPALLAALQAENPHLQRRLTGARALLAQPLAIYRVPYGFVHVPREGETMFRLGDQFGVVPSFAGDGMAMALHSAAVAAASFLAGDSAAAFHRRLRADIAAPIARAGALYRLGRRPGLQPALVRLAGWAPAAVRLAARLTRVRRAALLPGPAEPGGLPGPAT